METPIIILTAKHSYESVTYVINTEHIRLVRCDEITHIFEQCKMGAKFTFEGSWNVPDSERLYRFKYAKVDIDGSLEELALWNSVGSVFKFQLDKQTYGQ